MTRLWTPAHSARARQIGGLLPRTTKVGGWRFRRRRDDGSEYDEAVPIWDGTSADRCPIVPRDERVTQPSLRSLIWQRIDQGQTSGCAVASFSHAVVALMAKLGMARTELDWYKAYVALSGGRGGVEIGRVLSYAMSSGIPTKDGKSVVRVTEAWDAPSHEALVSALQRGAVLTYGHDIHAECALTEVVEGGREYLDTRNSWGDDWGEDGFHSFPLDEVELSSYGAAILRDLELRPIDTANFPDAE